MRVWLAESVQQLLWLTSATRSSFEMGFDYVVNSKWKYVVVLSCILTSRWARIYGTWIVCITQQYLVLSGSMFYLGLLLQIIVGTGRGGMNSSK